LELDAGSEAICVAQKAQEILERVIAEAAEVAERLLIQAQKELQNAVNRHDDAMEIAKEGRSYLYGHLEARKVAREIISEARQVAGNIVSKARKTNEEIFDKADKTAADYNKNEENYLRFVGVDDWNMYQKYCLTSANVLATNAAEAFQSKGRHVTNEAELVATACDRAAEAVYTATAARSRELENAAQEHADPLGVITVKAKEEAMLKSIVHDQDAARSAAKHHLEAAQMESRGEFEARVLTAQAHHDASMVARAAIFDRTNE